jgi:glycosyltransferase involved in cell wall biosynthesis
MARVLIVEENLASVGGGHFWDFARDLMAAAKSSGHEFTAAAHITAEDALRVEGVYPILSHGRRFRVRGKWGNGCNAVDFVVNNYHCYRQILRHLKTHGPVDCLFFPTACHYSVFAAWALLRFHPRLVHKAVIFFVQQPTWWPAGAASPQPEKIAPILRFALRLLRPLLLEKRAVLATETPVAQEEYRAMTGLDVHLWGHPVEVPVRAAKARTDKTLFSSFGWARHEKGSDILAAAIERCLRDPRFDHCEFFLQWGRGRDFKLPDGSLQTLSPEIRGHQRVRVIDGPLNREDYLELFEQTDAVVLPYRHTSYYGRLSRVSIEAVAAGIPMIASPGTHAAHIVAEQGAGVTMPGLSAAELVESMARFLEAREEIAEMAIQRSPSARLIHSPDVFVRDLLASIDAGQKPAPPPLGIRVG